MRQPDLRLARHTIMTSHVLACAYRGFGCSNGHISFGLLALMFLGLAAVGGIMAAAEAKRKKQGKPPRPPREPLTDMSPFTVSLLSGRNVPAYTAKVVAVTPGGITVRQSRCCARGHQSPAQAVTHAAAVKRRIETTGR